MKNKEQLFHCSQHGAVGQGIKNGRCELCWPPPPITTIAQVADLLEVEVARHRKGGWYGLAEGVQKILDYINEPADSKAN